MIDIDRDLLAFVAGGQTPAYNPSDNALGRVGPGRSMRFLGNYYTPEALAHDQDVRAAIHNGSSPLMAHVRALPSLLPAATSYLRARFKPGSNDMQLPG